MMVVLAGTALLSSCVSSKKYKKSQDDYTVLNNKYTQLQQDLKNCENDLLKTRGLAQATDDQNTMLRKRIEELNSQVDQLMGTNTQFMSKLEDLNVISGKQADNVRASLEKLAERDAYIKDLQGAMARKDSLNLALVMNLKGSFVDMNDQDIDVKVEKGVVFIDISDKMLFNTGQYNLTSKAKNVLAKVAAVMKGQPNIEFLVEGHTDNVPIRGGNLRDNWDLSVLRATAVVRSLQKDFGIEPARMTAGGRSEYKPKVPNDSAEGRAQNRRTRIVVLPELDQFFQLLEPNKQAGKPGE